MRIPTIRGVIDRRILVNYRVAPDVLARLLPAPFRPRLVHGHGMVGICLIRLRDVRPALLPGWLGIRSENAAHRAAVEWDQDGVRREGVYIRRRDTSSRFNTLVGGRLFPGIHHHARFDVRETLDHFEVALTSDDGDTSLSVVADLSDRLPTSSVFGSLEEASHFFEGGAMGYSATPEPERFQGLELHCHTWHVEPLAIRDVKSSYFDDRSQFPEGSITFDCALLMRGIIHEWQGHPDLCCAGRTAVERRLAVEVTPSPALRATAPPIHSRACSNGASPS
jgi:hypothetical protein